MDTILSEEDILIYCKFKIYNKIKINKIKK